MDVPIAGSPPARNPYPGPRSFSNDQRTVFCGRRYESRELFSLVVAHKIVLLYSQSGAGKSSLLNAGLVPLLLEEGFTVFPIARVAGRIPDSVPLENVPNPYTLNVLLSWSHDYERTDPSQLAGLSLSQCLDHDLASTHAGRRGAVRVLLFDQFEELFTCYPDRWKERGEFISQLAEALREDDYLRVVISMREEYLGPLHVHAHALPESLETTFRLERLDKDEALEAITWPLKITHRQFAPGVAETLVEELLKIKVALDHEHTIEVTGEYVEPVQLQVVCSGLWERLPPATQEITFEYLEDFGDVTDALSAFYDESLREATESGHVTEGTLRKWFEGTLITPVGTRGTVFRGASDTGGLPNAAVDTLEARHIIRCDSRSGSAWYELTHDRFLDPVLKSNASWRQAHGTADLLRRELEQKAETWRQARRPTEGLLSGHKLTEAQDWLEDPTALELGCSDNVLAFINASASRQRERRRRRQFVAFGLSGVVVLSLLFFVFIRNERVKQGEKDRKAEITKQEMARASEIKSKIATEMLRNRAFQILRERQQTLSANENKMDLLDALISKSAPAEATYWHMQKAALLLQQERFDDAVKEVNVVIDVAPRYAAARTSRGYARMLQNLPAEALIDFEYIRDKLTARDALNDLNLAVVFAQLGREPDARKSLEQALSDSEHGQNPGGVEEVLPPEITEATLRRNLVANGEVDRQALYFMRPLLDAWSGSESFLPDLQEAHDQARKIREDERQEASLVALTWAWFIERGQKPDYGLAAGQGMLWQEAGNTAYAARHFEAFAKAHADRKETRYNRLAEWVRRQKSDSSQVAFSFAKDDPVYLEAQSELLRTQGRYSDAVRVLNVAIAREPANARLYFNRMNINEAILDDRRTSDETKKKLYRDILADCEHVLKSPGVVPEAYFRKATAEDYLGRRAVAIRDLQEAVKLQPDHQSALSKLANIMEEVAPDHPEMAEKWYERYDRLFPAAESDMLAGHARVQVKMKRFADAYNSIAKAIALEPANYPYYQVRADAERGLGFTEAQIQRDWADGDRAAVEYLRRRAQPEDQAELTKWEKDRWTILSKFGDKFADEQTRCNREASTCVTFKVVHDHGEWTYLKITAVHDSHGNTRIVKIDRGTNDGVVLGSSGDVYARPAEKNGHQRSAAKIGSAEILSVDSSSALVKVTMTSPSGDGMVRVGDAVELAVRTPDLKGRSKLWAVLNSSIALSDLKGEKIADFRTLYKDESPELDERIYQRLLDDIHKTGRLYGDKIAAGEPTTAGRFAEPPRSMRQILEETTKDGLDRFFQYVLKARASYFGEVWKIGLIYADWVKSGMRED